MKKPQTNSNNNTFSSLYSSEDDEEDDDDRRQGKDENAQIQEKSPRFRWKPSPRSAALDTDGWEIIKNGKVPQLNLDEEESDNLSNIANGVSVMENYVQIPPPTVVAVRKPSWGNAWGLEGNEAPGGGSNGESLVDLVHRTNLEVKSKRSYGNNEKSFQHKAVVRRNYQMGKRDVQRQSNKKEVAFEDEEDAGFY